MDLGFLGAEVQLSFDFQSILCRGMQGNFLSVSEGVTHDPILPIIYPYSFIIVVGKAHFGVAVLLY